MYSLTYTNIETKEKVTLKLTERDLRDWLDTWKNYVGIAPVIRIEKLP